MLLPSHTYVPGGLKPNSVQMLLLNSYLPCHFENQGKMGEVKTFWDALILKKILDPQIHGGLSSINKKIYI